MKTIVIIFLMFFGVKDFNFLQTKLAGNTEAAEIYKYFLEARFHTPVAGTLADYDVSKYPDWLLTQIRNDTKNYLPLPAYKSAANIAPYVVTKNANGSLTLMNKYNVRYNLSNLNAIEVEALKKNLSMSDIKKYYEEIILGKLIKVNTNTIEYTNPAGNIIKWEEQLDQGIASSIAAKKAADPTTGEYVEGKVGDFLMSKKKVIGFNQIYKRTNGTDAAEIDIITFDEIIECKRNITLAKNIFTLDKQAAKIGKQTNVDFVNPYNKRKILYVDVPLPRNNNGELYLSDKQYIDNLKVNGIDFANSLQELQNLLK